jgi:hypothetical protein
MSIRQRILNILKRNPQAPTASPYFRAGETVSVTGQYRVFHSGHRLSHDVILLKDDPFPRCQECGANVHFELILANPKISTDPDFNVRLYEIPHPKNDKTEV